MDTPSRNASSPSSTAGSSPSLGGGSSSSLMASAPSAAHAHFLFAPPPPTHHQSCTDDEAAAASTPPPLQPASSANRRIEWTRSNILSFIEDYRQQRNLWDSASTGYHVKQTKFEALKALSGKYNTDIRTIRSKIKSLRSSFHREHGKVKNCRMRGLHYQPMWFAYDAIRFILPPGEDVKPLGMGCGGEGSGVPNLDAACLGDDFKLKEEVMEAGEEGEEAELNDGFDDICEQAMGKGEDEGEADGNNNDTAMHTYEPSYNGNGGKKGQRKPAKETPPKKAPLPTATTNHNTSGSGTDSTVSSTTTSPLPLAALKSELFGAGGGASNTTSRLATLNGSSSSSLMATVDALHEKAAAAAAAAALAEAQTHAANGPMTGATTSPAAASNSLSEVINYLALTRSRTNILAPILTCNNFSVYSNHHNNNSQHHNNSQLPNNNQQHHHNSQLPNNNQQHHHNSQLPNNNQQHHNNSQHPNNNSQQHRNNNNNIFNNGFANEDSNQNHNNNNNGGLDMSLSNGTGAGAGAGTPAANTTEQFVQRINAFVTAAAAASIVAANCQSNYTNNNNNAESFFNGIGSSRPADNEGPRFEAHMNSYLNALRNGLAVEAPGNTTPAHEEPSTSSAAAAAAAAAATAPSLLRFPNRPIKQEVLPKPPVEEEEPSTSAAAAAASTSRKAARKRKHPDTVTAVEAINGHPPVSTSPQELLGWCQTVGETVMKMAHLVNGMVQGGSEASTVRCIVAPGNPNTTAGTEDAGEPQPQRLNDSAEHSDEADECLVFGEYVGRMIRKLSMRAGVKNIICNALYQAEKREEEMRQEAERQEAERQEAEMRREMGREALNANGVGGMHSSASSQSQ